VVAKIEVEMGPLGFVGSAVYAEGLLLATVAFAATYSFQQLSTTSILPMVAGRVPDCTSSFKSISTFSNCFQSL
jgi:hypothetical protein